MPLFLLFSPLVSHGVLGISLSVNAWTILASVTVVAGGLLAFARWIRPKITNAKNDVVAVRDSIVGREEVTDSITGAVLSPALPGIGVRMDSQERQMAVITEAVSKIADSHIRLEQHDAEIVTIKDRLEKLEQASVERIVTRAESAAAYRAIEAAHNANPEADVK